LLNLTEEKVERALDSYTWNGSERRASVSLDAAIAE
jgi:hypothetical protein